MRATQQPTHKAKAKARRQRAIALKKLNRKTR